MRRIEHLPESVRSSVRSCIILHDLTRVVEELIFNSLDADATKVFVAVGIGTNFLKVVDNGYGVDRDGLVLLGERYATSRHSDFHALESRGNFGFHGEALSSIADVSLLEITTKAPGMPHGYRKVMKGCKCLHLGINDDNREVGTTVTVRDLFYNQPVRRKRMQSSPKMVLNSLKKCVLRIALVHSTVSFRVSDIESEVDILRTGSSLSPLQLLANNFGVEASKYLQEIEVEGNKLRLSGYISGPLGIYSMKALQYIYINSRFVCKGPIHKLLNQLANGYVDDRKRGDSQPQHEKRSRSSICPTFILDLSCPKSYYELTFEPTKNLVEFKDWGPILQFVQKAVTRFWIESTFNADLLPHDEVTKKRRKTQKTKEWDNLTLSPKNLSSYDTSKLEKLKSKALVIHDTNNLGRSSCSSDVFHFEATENELTNSNLQLSDHFSCDEDSIWKKDHFFTDKSYFKTGSSFEPNYHEFSDNARIHGHQERSSQFDFVPHHGPFSTIDDDLGVVQEKCFRFTGRDKSMEEEDDDVHHIFRRNSPTEDKTKKSWLFSKCTTTLRDEGMNFKCLSPEAEHFDEDIRAFDPKSEWGPPGSSTSIDTTFEDVFGSSFGYAKGVNFTAIQDEFFFDDSFWAEIDSNNGSFFSTCSKVCVDSFPKISDPFYLPLSVQSSKNKDKRIEPRKRTRRFSAPPFYKHRKKYSVLGSFFKEMSTEKTHSPATNMDSSLKEFIESKHEPMVGETGNSRNRQALNSKGSLFSTQTYVEDSFCSAKKSEAPEIEITEAQNGVSSILDLSKGLGPKTCENTLDSSRKWRNHCPEIKCEATLSNTEVEDPILNIGSGILNLSRDLLVPNCISRSNLEEARVLRQVDNKYIPVVAGRTLAIIDQHAADERIRLEELRSKVLSGETRKSTYLDAEQELVVPEIGYQLLQNYAEEIKKWGWICRIDGEGSPSFSKNLNTLSRRQTIAKLVGVPCILGVNLTDVDLLEFLQQLADTDGSSTIPPSVHRVLNNKACRGAIMFGDSLLPSECSLIVEELARTSLCFQCAHGRPTTVPLVDLTMLHNQIDTIRRCNNDKRDSWHGLRRHEINPNRAEHRLNRDVDIKH